MRSSARVFSVLCLLAVLGPLGCGEPSSEDPAKPSFASPQDELVYILKTARRRLLEINEALAREEPWRLKLGLEKPRFLHYFHSFLFERTGYKQPKGPETHVRGIRELLSMRRPDWDCDEAALRWLVKDHFSVCNRSRFRPIEGHPFGVDFAVYCDWGESDDEETWDDPEERCAQYIEEYVRNVAESQVAFFGQEEELKPFETRYDALSAEVLGASWKAWYGGALPDENFIKRLRALLEPHGPELADFWVGLSQRTHQGLREGVQELVHRLLPWLAERQELFRRYDLDGNGVADYWTTDVSGLHRLLVDDVPLALIDGQIAAMDGAPLEGDSRLAPPLSRDVIEHSPAVLYSLRVIPHDAAGRPWNATEGYALCAYPRLYGRCGRQTYILDASRQVWFKDIQGAAVDRWPADPGADGWQRATPDAEDDEDDMPHVSGPGSPVDDEYRDPVLLVRRQMEGAEPEGARFLLRQQARCEPSAPRLALVEEGLHADDAEMRATAVYVLRRLGLKHEAARPRAARYFLEEARGSPEALDVLGDLCRGRGGESDAQAAVARARESLESERAEMRRAAAETLGLLFERRTEGVDDVIALLGRRLVDPERSVRRAALIGLKRIGEAAQSAGAPLFAPLVAELRTYEGERPESETDWERRSRAEDLLRIVREFGELGMRIHAELLPEGSSGLRELVIESLANHPDDWSFLEEPPSVVVKALDSALKDPSPRVRVCAAWYRWAVTRQADPSLDVLLACIAQSDPREGGAVDTLLSGVNYDHSVIPRIERFIAAAEGDRSWGEGLTARLQEVRKQPEEPWPEFSPASVWETPYQLDYVRGDGGEADATITGRLDGLAEAEAPEKIAEERPAEAEARMEVARPEVVTPPWLRDDGPSEAETPPEVEDPAVVEARAREWGRQVAESRHSDPERLDAARELAAMGPRGSAGADGLRAGLKDAERQLRVAIAAALWKVTGEAEPTLAAIKDMLGELTLESEDPLRDLLLDMGPAAGPLAADLVRIHGLGAQTTLPLFQSMRPELPDLVPRVEEEARAKLEELRALPTVEHAYELLARLYGDLGAGDMGALNREEIVKTARRLLKRDPSLTRTEVTNRIVENLRNQREFAWRHIEQRISFLACLRADGARALERLSGDDLLRRYAIRALCGMGVDARPALKTLDLALADEDREFRHKAAVARWHVTGEAGPTLAVLLPLAKGVRYDKRWDVVEDVGAMGTAARSAVPELLEFLGSDPYFNDGLFEFSLAPRIAKTLLEVGADPAAVAAALARLLDQGGRFADKHAHTLGEMGPDATPALAAVEAAMQKEGDMPRLEAAFARWRITGEAGPTVEVLNVLDDTNWTKVLERVRAMGPAGKAAVPAVITAFGHGHWHWYDFEDTLRAIEADPAVVAAALVALLLDDARPSWELWSEAVTRLKQLGVGVQSLARLAVESRDITWRGRAMEELGRMGRAARSAVATLDEALDSPHASMRAEAAIARWKVTGEPDPSMKVLLALLEDPPEKYSSWKAASRLVEMGSGARTAIPALQRIVKECRQGLESSPTPEERSALESKLEAAERVLKEIGE